MADGFDGEIKISTKIDTENISSDIEELKNTINKGTEAVKKGSDTVSKNSDVINKESAAVNKNTKAKNKNNKEQEELNKKSKAFAPISDKFKEGLESLTSGYTGMAAAVAVAIAITKKYIQGIRDTSDAYKAQNDAETALQLAAKNNPYLNGEAVDNLKTYAMRLQEVTEISDNEALDVMAQLATTGRTEAEIMKIMGAAADYAAATHTDLASAAMQLNATYNGMSGALGKQIGEIKNLTEEELKQGNAVDIIAQKYKGFAKELANADKQAENSKKSFKEALGAITTPAVNAWDNFWNDFYKGAVSAIKSVKEWLDELSDTTFFGGGYNSSKKRVNKILDYAKEEKLSEGDRRVLFEENADILSNEEIERLSKYIENNDHDADAWEEEFYDILQKTLKNREKQEKTKEEIKKYTKLWQQASVEDVKAQKAQFEEIEKQNKQSQQLFDELQSKINNINEIKIKYDTNAKLTPDQENEIKELRKQQEALRTKEIAPVSILTGEKFQKGELAAYLNVLKEIEEQEERNALIAKRNADNKSNEYAAASNKALEDGLRALEVEAKAKGESVTAQDKYNLVLQNYIDLLTKTEGTIKEGYPVEQKRLKQLEEVKKALDAETDSQKKLQKAIEYTSAAASAIQSGNKNLSPAETLKNELALIAETRTQLESLTDAEVLEAQKGQDTVYSKQELLKGLADSEKQIVKNKVDEVAATEKTEYDKIKENQQRILELRQSINDMEIEDAAEKNALLKQLDDEYAESKIDLYKHIADEIKTYTDQTVAVANEAAELMLKSVQMESDLELANLELKYRQGEIGEEEYNKKVLESKRKAAKEQYKIQMFQWTASLLQASANIAQGVTAALSQTPPMSFILAGLTGAAGAVQIASLVAAKPVPPSFSTGGIVGGSSMYGDNIATNLNSREMVMNMNQQKGLWDFINGGSKGGNSGANIVVNNNAANMVSAQPRITKDQIELLIDARVNDSLTNGRYNNSLNIANNSMGGEFYGI